MINEPRSLAGDARQAGTSAAIGAALLLYFGFSFELLTPVNTTLGTQSWWLFYHTLRIGGVCLALVTVWLWSGHAPALLADGVISAVIGSIFILTGLGMFLSDGDITQPFVNGLCGTMFVSAGVYNARLYAQHRRAFAPANSAGGPDSVLQNQSGPHPVAHEALGQKDAAQNAQDAASPISEFGLAKPAPSEPEEPPAGYLASFGRKRRDRSSPH